MNLNGLIVSWSDPCDEVNCNDDRTADFYEIFYQSAQDGEQILTVFNSSARSAIITNFQVNTRYLVSIRTTSGIDTTLLETRRYIRSDRTDPILALTGDYFCFFYVHFLSPLFDLKSVVYIFRHAKKAPKVTKESCHSKMFYVTKRTSLTNKPIPEDLHSIMH